MSLERFVDAQHAHYEGAMAELRRGQKTGHWIWFIFPQIRGLGRSPTSQQFAITSIDEARAYLAHVDLGPRLRACAALVAASEQPSADAIFGPLDAMKVRSSMTLFHRADPSDAVFETVLTRYYDGPDPATDAILASQATADAGGSQR